MRDSAARNSSALNPPSSSVSSLGARPSHTRRLHVKEKLQEKEREIMKDVPNWEVGSEVYKSGVPHESMPLIGLPRFKLFR